MKTEFPGGKQSLFGGSHLVWTSAKEYVVPIYQLKVARTVC